MLVTGEREVKEGTLSPRKRSGETLKSITVEDFVKQIESEYPTL
jgi:threonyl-tRNA synthetase